MSQLATIARRFEQTIKHTRQLFIVEIKFRNDDPKIVIVMDDAASLFRYQVS